MCCMCAYGCEKVWRMHHLSKLAWGLLMPLAVMIVHDSTRSLILQSALRLKPSFTDAYNNMASALVQKGLIPQAVECYNAALQINPNLVCPQQHHVLPCPKTYCISWQNPSPCWIAVHHSKSHLCFAIMSRFGPTACTCSCLCEDDSSRSKGSSTCFYKPVGCHTLTKSC